MPYKKNEDLPENVIHILSSHAQDIYRAAFNSAWKEHANPADRNEENSREETAHKLAWNAVKKPYRKEGDKWTR
ncbi:cation transport regulator ChaB [Nitrosomonas sp. HPC101]|uniref:ChaB family protein n=1 Tax=Nitrosomonas sp. HPC101 TaxID=1658667 RepID=UPI001370F92A|nr:ChaB family protein [Nitrosomonas sp. HPC101]MXS86036.1 cation transport regulator ChaB [Nitrosomonas sp. HPC101]